MVPMNTAVSWNGFEKVCGTPTGTVVVGATGEPHFASGDDKDLLVFMVYVLRRLCRPRRKGRLHEAQRRHRAVVREGDQLGGGCVVQPAGENNAVQVPALHGVPHVVE